MPRRICGSETTVHTRASEAALVGCRRRMHTRASEAALVGCRRRMHTRASEAGRGAPVSPGWVHAIPPPVGVSASAG